MENEELRKAKKKKNIYIILIISQVIVLAVWIGFCEWAKTIVEYEPYYELTVEEYDNI